MAETKRISPFIKMETHDFVKDNFESVHGGVSQILDAVADLSKIPAIRGFDDPLIGIEYAVQAWGHLYLKGLQSLKGVFEFSELQLIQHMLTIRRIRATPKNPDLIIAEHEEAIRTERKDKSFKVDGEAFLNKLKSLEHLQLICLETWCHAALKEKNINAFLKTLV